MPESEITELNRKLDDIIKEFSALAREFSELNGTVKGIKIHDAPCKFLEQYKIQMSGKIKDLHNRIDEHLKDCHSSKSSRDSWVAIAVIICTLVTFLQPFIQKWIE